MNVVAFHGADVLQRGRIEVPRYREIREVVINLTCFRSSLATNNKHRKSNCGSSARLTRHPTITTVNSSSSVQKSISNDEVTACNPNCLFFL